jgi:RNA polymerase sigma-70 factor (ECF subfamily)
LIDEKRLAADLRASRHEAFAEFVAEYESRAVQTAWRVLGSRADAEDAAQEAFLRAWRARDSFRGDSKLSTWFYRILMSACTDMGRRKTARRRRESMRAKMTQGRVAETTSPGARVEAVELFERVMTALDDLSANQRRVFVLRHFDDMGPAHIARVLGMAEGTVKSHLARAVAALRKRLREAPESGGGD